MPVYVDTLQNFAKHPTATYLRCHMWADELHELQAMADAIGCQRSWIQVRPTAPKHHYDLSPVKRGLAIKHGAIEKNAGEWMMERKAVKP